MVDFILNGREVTSSLPPHARLLDVLREEFGLKAPKAGCGEGECGACAVLVGGKLFNSCLTPLANVRGKEVLTLEGFRESERYRVLEECFGKAGAVQCGFCTPGMIMAAEALLQAHPQPTEEEIRRGISGNLCRCTGYNMIVKAIKEASERGAGLW